MSKWSDRNKDGRYDPRTTYHTLSGVDIHFVPFSWDEYQLQLEGVRDRYRQQGLPIDVPQYEANIGGVIQKFDHDEKSILQAPPGTPEEDKAAVIEAQKELWAEHKATLKKFEDEDKEIMVEYMFLDSLGAIQLPEDNAWEVRQLKKDIKIPTDPEEKRRHYIQTILVKSRADLLDLMSTITAVSLGITKEADVETIRDSFRDKLLGGVAQLLRHSVEQVENPEAEQVESGAEVRIAESG